MRVSLASATVLLVATTSTNADISAGHYLWNSGTLPDSGAEYFTFRLFVDVTDTPGGGPDDWTASGLDLDLTGGVFFQYAFGFPPPPPPWNGDAEFDSYYTSPANYPNTADFGTAIGIGGTADTDTRLDTDWFDTDPTGNGEFVIAQITVLPSDPDWVATGLLQYSAHNTGGQLFDYPLTIPEPGGLAVTLLVGLAAMRRRR